MSALLQSAPYLSQLPAPPSYGTRPEISWPKEQPTAPHKPPRPVGGASAETHWQNCNREMPPDRVIADLRKTFVIDDASRVAAFVRWNRLSGPLLEAKDPLDSVFGDAAVKRLSLLSDEEGSLTLFCLVMVPGDMEEARRALRSFDQQWWLARCGRVHGKLNFDFELVLCRSTGTAT